MHSSCTFATVHVNDGIGANRHRATPEGCDGSSVPSVEAFTLPVHVPPYVRQP